MMPRQLTFAVAIATLSCGSETPKSSLTNVFVCAAVGESGICAADDELIATGAMQVFASASLDLPKSGIDVTVRWYHDTPGGSVALGEEAASDNQKGSGEVTSNLKLSDGLPAGSYRVQVETSDDVKATNEFSVGP